MQIIAHHETPMRDDPPLDENSIALAKAAQALERARCTAETGLLFIGDTPYAPTRKVLTMPLTPAERQKLHFDEAFTAPSNVYGAQLLESSQAADVAESISLRVHGKATADLPAKDRATCRFVGAYAVRATKDHWIQEARRSAAAACIRAMREECGDAMAQLPEPHLRALAGILVGAVLSGYHGILEGSRHLSPGDYKRITDGAR
jgi:hypothetical protein